MAAMASVVRREAFLRPVLESLLPQVDQIAIFLNGYAEPPQLVRELAKEGRLRYIVDPANLGAEQKFYWADSWDGIYLSTDDDLIYPPDYVEVMSAAVQLHDGRALVAAHGRTYRPRAGTVHEVVPGSVGHFYARIDYPRWINHGGTGVMAWDARVLKVPTRWTERNLADLQVALWAQKHSVPMWLIAHQAHWIESLAPLDPKGLYKTSQRENHFRRNMGIRHHGSTHGWKLSKVES